MKVIAHEKVNNIQQKLGEEKIDDKIAHQKAYQLNKEIMKDEEIKNNRINYFPIQDTYQSYSFKNKLIESESNLEYNNPKLYQNNNDNLFQKQKFFDIDQQSQNHYQSSKNVFYSKEVSLKTSEKVESIQKKLNEGKIENQIASKPVIEKNNSIQKGYLKSAINNNLDKNNYNKQEDGSIKKPTQQLQNIQENKVHYYPIQALQYPHKYQSLSKQNSNNNLYPYNYNNGFQSDDIKQSPISKYHNYLIPNQQCNYPSFSKYQNNILQQNQISSKPIYETSNEFNCNIKNISNEKESLIKINTFEENIIKQKQPLRVDQNRKSDLIIQDIQDENKNQPVIIKNNEFVLQKNNQQVIKSKKKKEDKKWYLDIEELFKENEVIY